MPNTCAYEIKKNEKVGRYAVAARNLSSGEQIISELPVAVGPKLNTQPMCLGCLSPVDASTVCSACGWPVCGPECEVLPMHKEDECKIFEESKVRFQGAGEGGSGPCPQYECVTPLRVLLAKERNPSRWTEEVDGLMSHCDIRKKQPQWGANQVNVVDFLRKRCKLESRFSEEDIHVVIGILEVNSFEVRTPSGAMAAGLYPLSALMSHNCVSNTSHSITPTNNEGERYRIVVRASVDIKAGADLYTSYTYCLDPTMLRREHLSLSKHFDCDCARCSDPAELGTHVSSLKCIKCDNGVIMSTSPLECAAPWKCSHCENSLTADQIRRILSVVQSEVDNIDTLAETLASAGESMGDVEAREKLLRQYRSVLHPNHGLVLQLKHNLSQLYGRADGYTLDDLPDILLERKIELCKEVLSVLDVVDPGKTRIRGLTLYELHVPLIVLARSRYEAGAVNEGALRRELQEAADVLKEAVDILCLEDPTTPEGSVGAMAVESLKQLCVSIETLPKE